ncbi:MAG: hypothetical protein JXA30_17005 [Deltaproteobacteria bacterium]|nr:hypothetical protein [Deltaproteobacteria bacterium]
MDSIGFVTETALEDLPEALKQKAIIRAGAVALHPIEPRDKDHREIYVGTLFASDVFKRTCKTEATNTFLKELAGLYREIYGHAPWNEYLLCSKKGCPGKRSIADVHKLPIAQQIDLMQLEEKKGTNPNEQRCPICGSPMVFFYPPSRILANIKKEFNKEVVATFLLSSDGKLQGFNWGWFGDADSIAEKLRDQFRCSVDHPMISATRKYMRESGKTRTLYLCEWAVSYAYRNTIFSLLLMAHLSRLGQSRAAAWGDADPVFIGVTLDGSSATNIYRRFGANVIYRDPKTKVAIMTNPIERGRLQYERFQQVLAKRLSRLGRGETNNRGRGRVGVVA